MQKTDHLIAGKLYRIVQRGNNDEALFFEPANKIYFKKLAERHLAPVCTILEISAGSSEISMVVKFKNAEEIPEKFRARLHLPISNLLNSYAKSINKRYGRNGSLFKVRFERSELHL